MQASGAVTPASVVAAASLELAPVAPSSAATISGGTEADGPAADAAHEGGGPATRHWGKRRIRAAVLAAILTIGTVLVFAGGRGLGVAKLADAYDAWVPADVVAPVSWAAALCTAYGMILTRGERIYRRLVSEKSHDEHAPVPLDRAKSGWRAVMLILGLHRVVPFKAAAASLFITPLLGIEETTTNLLVVTLLLYVSDIATYMSFTVAKARDSASWFIDVWRGAVVLNTKKRCITLGVAVVVATSFYASTFFLAIKGLVTLPGLTDVSDNAAGLDVAAHLIAFCAAAVNVTAKARGLAQFTLTDAELGQTRTLTHPTRLKWHSAFGVGYTVAFFLHTQRGLLTLGSRLGITEADVASSSSGAGVVAVHVGAAVWAMLAALAEKEFTVRHMMDQCYSFYKPTLRGGDVGAQGAAGQGGAASDSAGASDP